MFGVRCSGKREGIRPIRLIGQISLIICCAAALTGCRKQPGEAVAKPELLLYCGAGIRPAAEALIEAFQKEHSATVSPTYAGSGRLLGQISSLQKGDLYMPGAALYVDKAVEKGLADEETRRPVAYFVPVILVQKGNPHGITSLKDLTTTDVRIGIGDERACAVGKKTLKIFEKNSIPYADLEKKIVYKSGTVNELGLAIQLKNVDVVILWDANARHFAEYGTIIPIPKEENIPSTIPIVRLKSSELAQEAMAFIEFITSDRGRGILEGKKYTTVLPK